MSKTEFSIWLENKFLIWQTKLGEIRSLADFAEYLGVSQPTLSMWLNGRRTPNDVSMIQDLAAKLGGDIYNVIGNRKTDPLLQYIIANWDNLSPEKQMEFKRLIDEAGQGDNIANNRTSSLRRT